MKLIGFLHFLFLALLLGMTNAEAFHYDAAGRLVAVVYPNDSAVTYAYDPGGNLQTVRALPHISPLRVQPNFNMPGGGMERAASGDVPVRILRVDEY